MNRAVLKRRLRTLALAAPLALVTCLGAQAQDSKLQLPRNDRAALEETFVVDTRALNFRREPTVKGSPISAVQEGDYLLKTGETFNDAENTSWLRVIRANGDEGWVSAKYVAPVSAALGLVEGAAAFLSQIGSDGAQQQVAAKGSLRAGFVYVGPVGDAGWTYQHDLGRKSVAELPFVESTSFIESVPEDPNLVAKAIDDLVAQGNNLIFTTSYGYMDPTITAAKKHPDVIFMHNSGFKLASNVGTYFGRMYQVRYLSGIVAGGMTKTNQIGYVAAFPIPEVIRDLNAFTLGAQSVNPDVRVKVVWTNSWYAPGLERDRAVELLDGGADILAIHQDTPAAIQVAAQRGKYAIGFHSDMSSFGPEATLTSAVWNWGVINREIAKEVHEGTWTSDQIWWGLEEGMVELAPLSDKVSADLAREVEQRRADMIDGRLRVFDGPIRDSEGGIRVPSGSTLSDAEMLTMDFYVLGVEGGVAPSIDLPTDDETG